MRYGILSRVEKCREERAADAASRKKHRQVRVLTLNLILHMVLGVWESVKEIRYAFIMKVPPTTIFFARRNSVAQNKDLKNLVVF